jgi:hypothetical protein
MTGTSHTRWAALLAAHAAVWYVLGLYQPSPAAPQAGQLPFANSVQQRQEMIQELKEIGNQLKQQNALLRSGELRVIVRQAPPQ